MIWLIRDSYPTYINNSYNSTSKNKQPNFKKWAEGLDRYFFQRGNTDGQQAYEMMLNIANNQGNASQNYNEILPHTWQNGYHWKEHK